MYLFINGTCLLIIFKTSSSSSSMTINEIVILMTDMQCNKYNTAQNCSLH